MNQGDQNQDIDQEGVEDKPLPKSVTTPLGIAAGGAGLAGLGALMFPSESVKAMKDFTQIGPSSDPATSLNSYLSSGSKLTRNKIFGLFSGKDLVEYGRKHIPSDYIGKWHEWGPEQEQHYGSFNRGPISAYLQFLKETGTSKKFLANPEISSGTTFGRVIDPIKANFIINQVSQKTKELSGKLPQELSAKQQDEIFNSVNQSISDSPIAGSIKRDLDQRMGQNIQGVPGYPGKGEMYNKMVVKPMLGIRNGLLYGGGLLAAGAGGYALYKYIQHRKEQAEKEKQQQALEAQYGLLPKVANFSVKNNLNTPLGANEIPGNGTSIKIPMNAQGVEMGKIPSLSSVSLDPQNKFPESVPELTNDSFNSRHGVNEYNPVKNTLKIWDSPNNTKPNFPFSLNAKSITHFTESNGGTGNGLLKPFNGLMGHLPQLHFGDFAAKPSGPIFPNGQAAYTATQLKMPQGTSLPNPNLHTNLMDSVKGRFQKKNPLFADTSIGRSMLKMSPALETQFTASPAQINNQLLSRIPGGAENFVKEQEGNYKRLNSEGGLPYSIDYSRRNKQFPISVSTDPGNNAGPHYNPFAQSISIRGIQNDLGDLDPSIIHNVAEYNGLTSDAYSQMTSNPGGIVSPKNTPYLMGHELNHAFLDSNPQNFGDMWNSLKSMSSDGLHRAAIPAEKIITSNEAIPGQIIQGVKTPLNYQSSIAPEYIQGATSGLNGLRDITGRKLNTPQETGQAIDEIEANPQILNQLNPENARIFRQYMSLKQRNPEAAQKMREAIQRDSQVLAQNPIHDPASVKMASAIRPGLWANIRAKRRRGGKPAKPVPDLSKIATSLGTTKALIRVLSQNGIQFIRKPEGLAQNMVASLGKALGVESSKNLESNPLIQNAMMKAKDSIIQGGAAFYPKLNTIFVPKGNAFALDGLPKSPRTLFFHEAGHALHSIEDPGIMNFLGEASARLQGSAIAAERIANNNAINFMNKLKTPAQNIYDYISQTASGYKSHLRGHKNESISRFNDLSRMLGLPPIKKTPFSQIPKNHFSVELSENHMHPEESLIALESTKTASVSRPGLWANIRAKRRRGEKPAKPGQEGYPDKKNWKKLTHESKTAESDNPADDKFKPDYTPEQLKEMGVYREVYGKKDGPRLASLEAWPAHWYHPEDKMGWLEWYKKYSDGRRMEDDNRQINRWIGFKARHGGPAFQDNPTPRRAYALRNWGIDATKLVSDPKALSEAMAAYKAQKYKDSEPVKTAGFESFAKTIAEYEARTGAIKKQMDLLRNSATALREQKPFLITHEIQSLAEGTPTSSDHLSALKDQISKMISETAQNPYVQSLSSELHGISNRFGIH